MFSCEFCEISKNTFFTEHLCATASWAKQWRHNFSQKFKYFMCIMSSVSQRTHQRWFNVETTLIVNIHQRCFDVYIWLNMKVEPTYIYRRCFNVETTSIELHRFNVDKITLFQRWNFRLKWKLSRRMFIDVVSTLIKQRWNNIERITLIQRR